VPRDAAIAFEASEREADVPPDQQHLECVDPTTLHGLPVPPRLWLVPEWIPMMRATSLYGDGGLGKTLLAQMLATSCATGQPWLGLPVQRCRSTLFFAESDLEEMWQTQEAINDFYGCDFADLGAMQWLPRLGHGNDLMTFDGGRSSRTPLFDQLLTRAQEHDARLVITDTLADVFNGNESDRGQSRRFGQEALGYLARQINGVSLTLAHPSLTGMANGSTGSGSTAWKGTFRSQLYLTEPQTEEGEPLDPDVRVLTRVKSNRARRGETVEIKWQNGVFVPLHAQTTGIIASIEKRNAEAVFLELLDKVTAEGRFVSERSRASNFAPRIFALRPDRQRFRDADFKHAMERLFSDKKIKVGTFKSADRHEYPCIIRVDS
jgi:RecA-family ATPase